MGGTRAGGIKAAQKCKERYGENFYRQAGKLGGAKSRGGGFAYNKDKAKIAGKIGGKLSHLRKKGWNENDISIYKQAIREVLMEK